MIVWVISKLVCLMYGVEMIPEARAFFLCMSWFEMLSVTLWGVITFFTWLIKREHK